MDERQKKLTELVDCYKDLILEAEHYIFNHPELGFMEWETSSYMEEQFIALGYKLIRAGNIPGFYTDIDTKRDGPRLLIMAELDALPCEGHPNARNGVAHACGHNAQCAALLGIAAALSHKDALDGMCGSIRLMAVPAEEFNSPEYRADLRREGIISYYSGKTEFLRRGYMDGVDMAFLFHTGTDMPYDFYSIRKLNGNIVKKFTYHGKAAHAAAGPHLGINALYAATLGLNCINALRETFRDEDHVRIHSIITKGGSAVNVIPSEVTGEIMVRGGNFGTICEVNERVNRALAGTAYAMGAGLTIHDFSGTMPENNDLSLMKIAERCMIELSGEERVCILYDAEGRGSSDMGDLSSIMPTIQPKACGASGKGHSTEYHIADPQRACINSAKAQLLLAYSLLKDGAIAAKGVISGYQPVFESKEALFFALDGIMQNAFPVICTHEKCEMVPIS